MPKLLNLQAYEYFHTEKFIILNTTANLTLENTISFEKKKNK